MNKKIKLSEYVGLTKVLAGRDNGEILRNKLKIEEIEKSEENIMIIIPESVKAFNSSYFLGAFGRSVRKLGRIKFNEKYIFQCTEVIKENIEDGINEAIHNDDIFEE